MKQKILVEDQGIVLTNTMTPKSDWNLNSPYNITAESHTLRPQE